MTGPVVLVSAAALFNEESEILLARRPPGKSMAGLWEFPGGKIEPGETPEAALARELSEELRVMVNETSLDPVTFASFPYPDFHLLMVLFASWDWIGPPTPLEGQELAWVKASDLKSYPAPPADIPLFEALAGGSDWRSYGARRQTLSDVRS